MKIENYFRKYGYIYGVSYKPGFWGSAYAIKFYSLEEAIRWLYTEEYSFRSRELCSRSKAVELVGPDTVKHATEVQKC